MKGLLLCLLFAVPALVRANNLDSECGGVTWIYADSVTYYIFSNSRYNTLCNVNFDRSDYGKIKLTITGTSLLSSQCQVNVYGGSDIISLTGGDLDYFSSFSRSVTSDNLGNLYLHVTGNSCNSYGLSFQVEKVHDCADGFYCWSIGSYVGFSIGIFVFIFIVPVVSVVFYRRRRVVMVQSNPGLISSSSTVVTQSRW